MSPGAGGAGGAGGGGACGASGGGGGGGGQGAGGGAGGGGAALWAGPPFASGGEGEEVCPLVIGPLLVPLPLQSACDDIAPTTTKVSIMKERVKNIHLKSIYSPT